MAKMSEIWRSNQAIAQKLRAKDAGRTFPSSGVPVGHRYPLRFAHDDGWWLTEMTAGTAFYVDRVHTDFLTSKGTNSLFMGARDLLAAIPSDAGAFAHLTTTTSLWDGAGWLAEYTADAERRNAAGIAHHTESYLERAAETARHLADAAPMTRDVTLIVTEGPRHKASVLTGAEKIAARFSEALLLSAWRDKRPPTADEKEYWATQLEERIRSLRCAPLTLGELSHLTQRTAAPGLPVAHYFSVDAETRGAGAWANSYEDIAEVVPCGLARKCVRVGNASGQEKYVAYLPAAEIPGHLNASYRFVDIVATQKFPCDTHLFYEMIDPERAARGFGRRKALAKSNVEDSVERDGNAEEQLSRLEDAERQASQGQKYTRFQYYVVVWANTTTELADRVSLLTKVHAKSGVKLVWPPDDQMDLRIQSLPGSAPRCGDWFHEAKYDYLGAFASWTQGYLGNRDKDAPQVHPTGEYVGRSVNMSGTKGLPVFWWINDAAKVGPPVQTWAATSGSGKTYSGGTSVLAQGLWRGTTQLVADPKGDAISLYRDRHILFTEAEAAKVKLVDMSKGNVTLDAMRIPTEEDAEAMSLPGREVTVADLRAEAAKDVLMSLTAKDPRSDNWRTLIESAVEHVVSNAPDPIMRNVLDVLQKWQSKMFDQGEPPEQVSYLEDRSRSLYELHSFLTSVSKHALGRLLIPSREAAMGSGLRIEQGDLLIFLTKDLTTGDRGGSERDKVISETMMGLLLSLMRSMCYELPKQAEKHIMIDEWHTFRDTTISNFIGWLRRVARSQNIGVTALAQAASDFKGMEGDDAEKQSVSAVWLGPLETDDDAHMACRQADIEANEHNINLYRRGLARFGKGHFTLSTPEGTLACYREIVNAAMAERLRTESDKMAKMDKEAAAEGF